MNSGSLRSMANWQNTVTKLRIEIMLDCQKKAQELQKKIKNLE